MNGKIPVLIITGYGLNCEAESSFAWEQAGAEPRRVHLNDLLERPAQLQDFGALMFIGGFSYGDHMGSGLVFAHRVRHHLRDELQKFICDDKLVLAVCNGFQIVTKLGLLPATNGDYFTQSVSLMQNDCGHFQNRWVTLRFEKESPCVFTRGIELMPLPARHGEGKIFTTDKSVLEQIESKKLAACRYADPKTGESTMEFPQNPNGSLNAIAGLCDPTGRIFGLMPHPEAYLFPENHPQWDLQKIRGELPEKGLGLKIFKNAVAYLH